MPVRSVVIVLFYKIKYLQMCPFYKIIIIIIVCMRSHFAGAILI